MPSMMPQVVNPNTSMSSAAALIMASQQHEPGVANKMYQEEQQHLRRASADNLLAGSGVEGSGHGDKLEMKQRSMSTPATPKQGELIMGLAHGPTDAPMMMMPGKVVLLQYAPLWHKMTYMAQNDVSLNPCQ